MIARALPRQSFALVVLAAISCSSAQPQDGGRAKGRGAPAVLVATASGQNARVEVEVARTEEERERGLMYRERLGENQGMLFVFGETGEHAFWMKNTLLPLDMIFIDGTGTIAGIVARAEPGSLTPRSAGPSRYVLEVNGGWCERNGVKPGDRVRFENLRP